MSQFISGSPLAMMVKRQAQAAVEEVGGEDEDEDSGADTDHGAHGLEALHSGP
jgi:hypothetical protein